MSTPTSVRLPEPLREHLSARATAERRSLSNLVTALLAGALDARGSVLTEADWIAVFRETFEGIDGGRH